jgi:class 3 adenylate cyclase/tetratricopeptide (TPR) repeat protein/energy-coupling factor transporter ATP-binding protein EcfA2
MDSLSAWLQMLGLERYAAVFAENEVDLDTLRVLSEADLEQLGLPFGPRKRLVKALADLASKPAATLVSPSRANQLPSAPDSSTEAERRHLTVMFCDLVGSTALAQKLDPEELRDLMQAYQRACGEVISSYDGHVAQYLGDGLMVYFGWPKAHEDDAERAVRASLDVVDAVKSVPAAAPLQVRIGIATGPVVVGETGAGDASVPKVAVGETPNLAARLQGLAGTDEIVVGPTTQRLLGTSFEYRDLGRHALKGIVEPVHAWRVLGAASVEGRFEATREAGALTPLVGREEEIQLLLHRWEQAKAGEGQVVLLCGEPGVGKSRILQVLRERIAQEPHTRLRYQCSPFHSNSAFHPVIEQFERAAGFSREDSPGEKLEKMEALLGAGGGDVKSVAPLFAAMLSLPLDRYPVVRLSPQQRKDNTIEAQVAQALGLARTQPVLFLFEDAHWADPTTLETFDRLVNRIESACVLMVVTYRPGFVPAWIGQPRVATLTLARLSRREAAALAEKVTRGKLLPPDVLDQIVAKTDGVPLFVEELTKAVIESGLLRDCGDRYELDGPLPPLAIPSTLQDSLMSRLDRLAPVKEVAQIGAAIGREFSHELLAAVSPRPAVELEATLEQLVASELVIRRGHPPAAIYAFKHALVQDAAYQSILRSRRQQLHASIARALDAQFPDVTEGAPELLAAHYEKAGMPDDAVAWFMRAGHRAQVRSANKEAVNHLERALSLLNQILDAQQRPSIELDIRARLGTLHMMLEGWTSARARPQFERVHELRDVLGHEQQKFISRAGLIMALSWTGRASEARVLGEELVHVANGTKQKVHELIARERYGASLMYLGRYQDATDQWNRVLELYDRETDVELAFEYGHDPGVCALAFCAYTYWQLGYPEKARHCADASVVLARSVGHAFTLAFALTYAGVDVSYFMRDPDRALAFAREGEEVTKKGSFGHLHALCSFHHAWSLTRLGSSAGALDRMRQALDDLQQLGMVAIIAPRMTAQLAETYARAGKPDEGLEILAASPDRAPGRKRVRFSDIYWIEGDLHLAKSKPDPTLAESCYLEAVGIAIEDKAKIPHLRASLRLARLWLSQGKGDQARGLLQPLYHSFTEGFGIADLMEAKQVLEHAQTVSSLDSRPAA